MVRAVSRAAGAILPLWARKRIRGHGPNSLRFCLRVTRQLIKFRRLVWRASREGRPVVVIGLIERLGDIVANTPVAQEVRRTYPRALVCWAVRGAYKGLFEGHPYVDELLSVDCIGEWTVLRRRLAAGRVYDLHIPGQQCWTCGLRIHKTGRGSEVNLGNYYDFGPLLASFTTSAGRPLLNGQPVLGRTGARTVARLGLPSRYICVHTVSEDAPRQWTADKWNQLIDWLASELGVAVIEVGLRSLLGRADGQHYRNLCGKCTLPETIEVVRRAALLIGIDSGIAHIANATMTPGVILMGRHAKWEKYMPYSGYYRDGGCLILTNRGDVKDLPVETVQIALSQIMAGDLAAAPKGVAASSQSEQRIAG